MSEVSEMCGRYFSLLVVYTPYTIYKCESTDRSFVAGAYDSV